MQSVQHLMVIFLECPPRQVPLYTTISVFGHPLPFEAECRWHSPPKTQQPPSTPYLIKNEWPLNSIWRENSAVHDTFKVQFSEFHNLPFNNTVSKLLFEMRNYRLTLSFVDLIYYFC